MKKISCNLNLCSKGPVDKQDVLALLGREVASFKKRIRSLEMILCHCVWYPDSEILISLSNDTYPIPRYNPMGISAKPFIWVIKHLNKLGYIKLNQQRNPLKSVITGDEEPVRGAADTDKPKKFLTSSFTATPKGLGLAAALGITDSNIHIKNHVYLKFKDVKDERGKQALIEFAETEKTKQMEADMSIYCDYLNQQDIRLDGKQFKNIHLFRNFIDYDGTGKLEYGGRSGGYWTQVWKEDRSKITINGKKTTSKGLDYSASQYNRLYEYLTGKCFDGDPYELIVGRQKHKIPRSIVKKLAMYALNVKESVASKRLNYFYTPINKTTEKKKANGDWSGKKEAALYHSTMKLRGVSPLACKKAFLKKHHVIKDYLYQDVRGGQFAVWLESNLVFAVARTAADWNIPCLTIHDEFLVAEEHQETMRELMYSVFSPKGDDFVDFLDRKEYIRPPKPYNFGGSELKEEED